MHRCMIHNGFWVEGGEILGWMEDGHRPISSPIGKENEKWRNRTKWVWGLFLAGVGFYRSAKIRYPG